MAKDLGDFVWIGLRDIQSEGSWQWYSNFTLIFLFIKKNYLQGRWYSSRSI